MDVKRSGSPSPLNTAKFSKVQNDAGRTFQAPGLASSQAGGQGATVGVTNQASTGPSTGTGQASGTMPKQQQPIQHPQGAMGAGGGWGKGAQPGQFHFNNPNRGTAAYVGG
uniref:Uncharacterized protein n=1 Tax=Romanomermis culicivorax TaxID=13658 RepID=A0A915HHF2_ROMCU